jgi:hypothetical protein
VCREIKACLDDSAHAIKRESDDKNDNESSSKHQVELEFAQLSDVQRFVLPPAKREIELQV